MSLVNLIENLRSKPRHVRVRIMWVGAVLGAGVLFSFWVWSLGQTISQARQNTAENNQLGQGLEQFKKDVPTLWQSLGAGIGNVVSTVKDQINKAPDASPAATFEQSSDISVSPEPPEIDGRLPLE